MTKNPFLNALAAVLYISVVASLMFYGPERVGPVDSVLLPIAMLSLFVLSVATMGYIFFYEPFQLYFDGKKKEALDLFLKTIAIFAGVTVLVFSSLVLVIAQ